MVEISEHISAEGLRKEPRCVTLACQLLTMNVVIVYYKPV